MSLLLPSFLRHALFQTPSTSYHFSRFSLTLWENFRNFARPFKASTRAKKWSSVYTSRSRREREIKNDNFASFRASLRPVLFVDRCFCINRNFSPPKTKPPWREESWTEVLSVVCAVLCCEFTRQEKGLTSCLLLTTISRLFIVGLSWYHRFDKQ